jgi:hypothetical protein
MQTKYEKINGGKIVAKYSVDDSGKLVGTPQTYTPESVAAMQTRLDTMAAELKNISSMFGKK